MILLTTEMLVLCICVQTRNSSTLKKKKKSAVRWRRKIRKFLVWGNLTGSKNWKRLLEQEFLVHFEISGFYFFQYEVLCTFLLNSASLESWKSGARRHSKSQHVYKTDYKPVRETHPMWWRSARKIKFRKKKKQAATDGIKAFQQ